MPAAVFQSAAAHVAKSLANMATRPVASPVLSFKQRENGMKLAEKGSSQVDRRPVADRPALMAARPAVGKTSRA